MSSFRSFSSRVLVASSAIVIIFAPLALAGSSEQGTISSNGISVNNPGFDARGEALNKVITAIQGRVQPGVPNIDASKVVGLSSNGISYHKGPVMTDSSGLKLNIIWYGTWTDNQKTIVKSMVNNLTGSPYYNINTTYYDASNKKVQNKVTLVSEFNDAGSQGTVNLSDQAIWDAVVKASNSVPSGATNFINDINALTLVLTGTNVTKSGFLTSYCGWHSYNPSSTGVPVKYSFVGNPGTSSACAAQTTSSPNGDVGVDALISVAVHEIVEAVTDPQLNAWYDSRGYENADKCAWNFGTTTTTSGYKWNVTLGTGKYLIQQNWLNANGGGCRLSY